MYLADLIGKPFKNKGRGPDGFDCWGLVLEVYRRCGIDLPDYDISAEACEQISKQMCQSAPYWTKLESPEVPCLAIIKNDAFFVQHLGVYIGSGKVIHAQNFGVAIDRIETTFLKHKIRGFFRYVG